jgi:8-oxo-dGTP diphosphatase
MAHDQIEAAGVVLVRPGPDGPEVAVVHRPHRSDWSLPKGKLEPGERHDVAAVREAFEETGVRAALGPSLGQRRYLVQGVAKRVRYWRATVLGTTPRDPDAEVDEIRWLRRKAAKSLLSYEDDRLLVDDALALPDTRPTIVLRHAEATKRAAWRESEDPQADSDRDRPLNEAGMRQAHDLVEILACYAPTFVVSSDARRCRATVEPYAARLGSGLVLEHALSEEGCADDPATTTAAVAALLDVRDPAVWCTHRPVLPIVMGAVAATLGVDRRDHKASEALDPRLRPGAAIVLHRSDANVLIAADRLDG